MRLGATIEDYLKTNDPDAHLAECRRQGYRASPAPSVGIDDSAAIRRIVEAYAKADVRIAEVTAWVNPLHPDPVKRKRNLAAITEALALADELDAACCATAPGSFNESDSWDSHVGHHAANFTDQAFDALVTWVRDVLNAVKPRRTKLTIEMCPWAVLDGPELYRRLIESVGDDGLAAHIDPANCVVSPRVYYDTPSMVDRIFDTLGPWIRSCHAKDIHWTLDARTVAIEEVPPGKGVLDYGRFLTRLQGLSPDIPLVIEHLGSEAAFTDSAAHIRAVAAEQGITL